MRGTLVEKKRDLHMIKMRMIQFSQLNIAEVTERKMKFFVGFFHSRALR